MRHALHDDCISTHENSAHINLAFEREAHSDALYHVQLGFWLCSVCARVCVRVCACASVCVCVGWAGEGGGGGGGECARKVTVRCARHEARTFGGKSRSRPPRLREKKRRKKKGARDWNPRRTIAQRARSPSALSGEYCKSSSVQFTYIALHVLEGRCRAIGESSLRTGRR